MFWHAQGRGLLLSCRGGKQCDKRAWWVLDTNDGFVFHGRRDVLGLAKSESGAL
jgi:hypothetical protein